MVEKIIFYKIFYNFCLAVSNHNYRLHCHGYVKYSIDISIDGISYGLMDDEKILHIDDKIVFAFKNALTILVLEK